MKKGFSHYNSYHIEPDQSSEVLLRFFFFLIKVSGLKSDPLSQILLNVLKSTRILEKTAELFILDVSNELNLLPSLSTIGYGLNSQNSVKSFVPSIKTNSKENYIPPEPRPPIDCTLLIASTGRSSQGHI